MFLILLAGIHLLFAIKTNLYFKEDDFTTLAYFLNNSWWEMISTFLMRGDLFGFRKVVGYIGLRSLFEVFGVNQYGYLIVNHMLHTVNVLLVFFLSKKISKNLYSSFFASVLFNGLYLFYFSNFHEYLLVTLSLLSIYTYMGKSKYKKFSPLLFLLALLTKEMAFTVILFLAAWTYVTKKSMKDLRAHFFVIGAYVIYQMSFFLLGKAYPKNLSYAASFSFPDIYNNLKFYISPFVLAVLAILSLTKKNYRKLLFLLVFLIGLSPVLPLNNRHEMYYFLLPSSYLYIYIAVVLPRLSVKNALIYLIVFFVLGGRSLLPSIPKQNYPNWQKISIENVIERIETNLQENPETESINLSDIEIERDARLMLTEGSLELFLEKETVQNYDFVYETNSNKLVVLKKQ